MKRLIACFSATLAAASLAAPAAAAEWLVYRPEADGITMSIDVSSLEIKGNKRTVWSKAEFTQPRQSENGMLKEIRQLLEIDCLSRVQRRISEVGADPAGASLYQLEESKEVGRVLPETVGERRLVVVCGYKAKK